MISAFRIPFKLFRRGDRQPLPLFVFLFFCFFVAASDAQQAQPIQMASLHPAPELHWQRTSPAGQQSEGPVLYQLVFSPGATGTLARFDTNPRHLANSDITDNGGVVAVGSSGFTINAATGIVNFVNAQTFPGAGTVNSVASGSGLTGGTITTSGTLSLDTNFTNNLYPQLAAANTFTAGTQAFAIPTASMVGLTVQGASAQTANLEEWRNSSGTALASVSAAGKFSGDGSGLTNLSNSQFADGNLHQRKAALLQWYRQDFPVGSNPWGVAFDSANIWVANNFDNTVSKLRASDGTTLGTFPVGSAPVGVAFDGANIWVANSGDNTVSKLRASDGATLGTFPVAPSFLGTGFSPEGLAFDGTNIWVTNYGSANVSVLRASDGSFNGLVPVGNGPVGIAFDGGSMWVANYNSNTVTKINARSGAILGTFSVGTNPQGMAFDRHNIWVANVGDNTVTELYGINGAVLATFPVGTNPEGVAFDGKNIWVANYGSNNVTKLRSFDGANLGTFSVGANPWGVAFDGANIWVGNIGSNSVTRQ